MREFIVTIFLLGLITFALYEDKGTEVSSGKFDLPDDLKHCELVHMSSEGLSPHHIYLVKCPEGYLGTSYTYPVGEDTVSAAAVVYER